MSAAADRLRQRREAQSELGKLFGSDNAYIVHYACESFFNRRDGTSPRITSIAVSDLQNGQAESFSIHLHAEHQNIKLEEIVSRYDSLERAMLDEFYAFMEKREKARWIVWNMRDVNYGFPAIAQRYRALGGKPVIVSGAALFDLAEALQDIYGPGFVEHPHLTSVMKLNKITDRSYMAGKMKLTPSIIKTMLHSTSQPYEKYMLSGKSLVENATGN